MNYDAVAKDILTLAGGPGNVENLTHCFTRLRLELSDRTKSDKEKLAQVEGVVYVVERGGQLQVVIGTKVEYVYEAVCRQMEAGKTPAGKISAGKTPAANKDIQAGAGQGTSVWNRILISISAMFTPMVPAVYLVFGPVGIYIGNAINYVYTGMMALSPALCGAFIGGMWCVFVIFGAHRALVPIGINDVARLGRQNLLAFAGAANFSQGGAALGVMLRTKDRNLKAIAASASLTAWVCGITEPAIYGCNLRLKKPMVYAVICGAAGGAVMGIGGVYGDAFANNGVLTLATYGAFGMRNFLFYLLGISISFFGAALLTWVLGFEELDEGENRG